PLLPRAKSRTAPGSNLHDTGPAAASRCDQGTQSQVQFLRPGRGELPVLAGQVGASRKEEAEAPLLRLPLAQDLPGPEVRALRALRARPQRHRQRRESVDEDFQGLTGGITWALEFAGFSY